MASGSVFKLGPKLGSSPGDQERPAEHYQVEPETPSRVLNTWALYPEDIGPQAVRTGPDMEPLWGFGEPAEMRWALAQTGAPQFIICPDPGAEDLYVPIEVPGGGKGDSGVDLRFPADVTIPSGATLDGGAVLVGLGVRARCLVPTVIRCGVGAPRPYLLFPRSSLGKTPLSLANAVGLVDAGYTGELRVALRNHSACEYTIRRGASLFQLACPGLTPATVEVVAPGHPLFAEGASVRGAAGYGSTGVEGSRQ